MLDHVEENVSAASPRAALQTKKPKEQKRPMTTETTETTQTPTKGPGTAAAASAFRHLFRPGISFKLLLAIEDDDNAQTAIRVTDALTARGAVPTVIRVTAPMLPPFGTPDSIVLYPAAALDGDFHYNRRASLHDLIAVTTGKPRDWPIRSVAGDPPLSIIEEAESQHSELIVMGIHQHGTFAQALGENTATRVMTSAAAPVLGIRPGMSGVPRRIMVATDFGDASREAAHIAANLAEPDGSVILIHVSLPSPITEEGDEGAALVQREGIEHAFTHLIGEISEGKSIRVETVNRTGDVGDQLMAAGQVISPDLIAIASQRHHLMTHVLLGKVTRKLARECSWPMLVTPPVTRIEPR
jgi:nucleotide-binding universal stress UspA family protein